MRLAANSFPCLARGDLIAEQPHSSRYLLHRYESLPSPSSWLLPPNFRPTLLRLDWSNPVRRTQQNLVNEVGGLIKFRHNLGTQLRFRRAAAMRRTQCKDYNCVSRPN